MTVDIARVAVITGDGVVARYPGLLCVARCGDRDVVLRLLDVCAGAAGPDPGRTLARRLATWMGGPDAPGDDLEFGTVAVAGDQLGVFLVGSVAVAVPGNPVSLSGSDAATFTDRLIPVPPGPVVVSLDGVRPPAGLADGVNDLRAGVVPGAGALLFPVGRAAPSRPDPGAPSALDGPTIRTPAHSGAAHAGQAATARSVVAPDGVVPNATGPHHTGPNGVVRNGTARSGVSGLGTPGDGGPGPGMSGLLAGEPSPDGDGIAEYRRSGPRNADPRTPDGYEWFADWSEGGAQPGPTSADPGRPDPGAAGPGRWPWSEPSADRFRPDEVGHAPTDEALLGGPEDARPGGAAEGRAGGMADGRSGGMADGRSGGGADGRPGGGADGRRGGVADGRFGGVAEGRPGGPADGGAGGVADGPPSGGEDVQPGRVDESRFGGPDEGRSGGAAVGRLGGVDVGGPGGEAEGRPGGVEGARPGGVDEPRPGRVDEPRPGYTLWTESPTLPDGSARTARADERTNVWVDPAIRDDPADPLVEGRHAIVGADLAPSGEDGPSLRTDPPAAAFPPPAEAAEHHDAVPVAVRFAGPDDATPVDAVAAVDPAPVTEAAPEAPESRPAPDDRRPDERRPDDRRPDDRPAGDRMPDDRAPDGPSPDDQLPDERLADDRLADDRLADDRLADGRFADGRVADGRVADGRVADDRMADDRVPDGRGPDGRASAVEDAPSPAPRPGRVPTPAPRSVNPTGPAEARPEHDEPLLHGLLCEDGHLNDPRASACVACGATVGPGEDVVGPRPPLGRIVFDDGATFTVDAEYLVGRMPEADPRARSGELQPIVVEDRSGSVSRVHAEILINGWDVVLVDSGSRNGTFVAGPDDSGWTPLAPGRTSLLLPGTRVRMGGRTFVFEPPVAVG